VGAGVFAIVAAGVASSTSLTSRLAISNLYSNTANTVVQGYAEQIKSIRYTEIKEALDSGGTEAIPTMSLTTASGTLSELSDPLFFGVRSEKQVVIDVEKQSDGSERERVMRLWVTPTGNDLTGTAANLSAIEVTLAYEWEEADRSILRRKSGEVKIVKTAVSEY